MSTCNIPPIKVTAFGTCTPPSIIRTVESEESAEKAKADLLIPDPDDASVAKLLGREHLEQMLGISAVAEGGPR